MAQKIQVTCDMCGGDFKIPVEDEADFNGLCPICARETEKNNPQPAHAGNTRRRPPAPPKFREFAFLGGLAQIYAIGGMLCIAGGLIVGGSILAGSGVDKVAGVTAAVALGISGLMQLGLGQAAEILIVIERRTRDRN
ncbi:MAG TPA: hypothetical protein VGH74_07505 [Planctomycetaceae bacterium]|jgi:hypothetical protein